jgi:hypothetical protein
LLKMERICFDLLDRLHVLRPAAPRPNKRSGRMPSHEALRWVGGRRAMLNRAGFAGGFNP